MAELITSKTLIRNTDLTNLLPKIIEEFKKREQPNSQESLVELRKYLESIELEVISSAIFYFTSLQQWVLKKF